MRSPSDEAVLQSPAAMDARPVSTRPSIARPLALVLFVLLCLGGWLRLNAFGYPQTLQFDEHHFVENARNYLRHLPDWNDHPPLGKLILATSIRLFGDHSIGWRLPSLIFGSFTILLGGWAAARLFRNRGAGYVAAAFLGADGFLIAYSRAALLDGFLATSAVGTLLLCSFDLSWATALLAGMLLGFSVSIKFSGIAIVVPLLLAWSLHQRWDRRRVLLAGLALTVAVIMSFGLYRFGLALAGQPHAVTDIVRDVQRLFEHHAQLTDMKNPATSGWITWAVPVRPLHLGRTDAPGQVRLLSMLGNLAIWWAAVCVALLALRAVLRHGTVAVARQPQDPSGQDPELASRLSSPLSWPEQFVHGRGRAVLVLLATVAAFLAPWVLTHRDSYIYHFLPSYAALVVLLAGFIAWVAGRSARFALVFCVIVLLVAAFYGPIWAYLPVTRDALTYRLFLPSWR
ncbi:MAG: phospholipid carrier-dependent glycosyltransferase [Deltaproteobacteria bacterium]|nr:phospholipid carrier-dependent glycosyltransferase [Deltaproteobacteria bacterium]